MAYKAPPHDDQGGDGGLQENVIVSFKDLELMFSKKIIFFWGQIILGMVGHCHFFCSWKVAGPPGQVGCSAALRAWQGVRQRFSFAGLLFFFQLRVSVLAYTPGISDESQGMVPSMKCF